MSDRESIGSDEGSLELPNKLENYKVASKKSVQEYQKLDQEDESLMKWKKSLGLDSNTLLPEFANDKRIVVVKKFELHNLTTDTWQSIEFPLYKTQDEINLFLKQQTKNDSVIKIKESSFFQIKIVFQIYNEIITGLKYQQTIKKSGIPLDKLDNQLGSYPPNTESKKEYSIVLPEIEAPSGFLGRGSYTIVSKFIDDDKVNHLTLNWGVEITK